MIEREEGLNPKIGATLRSALKTWRAEVIKADWKSPADVTAQFSSADQVGNGRIVFNICGNKFRLSFCLTIIFQI